MPDYGTIGHLLSESYIARARQLESEGMDLGEAAEKAHAEMVFAGRITEQDVMPRLSEGEALPGEVGTVASVPIDEQSSAETHLG